MFHLIISYSRQTPKPCHCPKRSTDIVFPPLGIITWQRCTSFFCDEGTHLLPNTNHVYYSLQSILPFGNTDVSRYILVLDTSIFAKGNMGRREYCIFLESLLCKHISGQNIQLQTSRKFRSTSCGQCRDQIHRTLPWRSTSAIEIYQH
jgi:hypothetical protein